MPYLGIVLCGGPGKRLRPITDTMPKPLLELKDGYTILDKQLLDLKYAGVKRVILLTGHLHERIEERYGRGWNGVDIAYSVEDKPLGTWGAVANALKDHEIRSPLVIMNGDIVTDVNLRKMVAYATSPVTMFLTPMRSPYGIVELSGRVITQFREKPILPYYINAGVYVVREDFDLLGFAAGGFNPPSDIEREVFPKLAGLGMLGGYVEADADVFWKAVDTVKDLEEVRNEFRNRVDKPWGFERVIAYTDKYLHKKLFIKEGYQTSLHYHSKKQETMYVVRGRVEIAGTGVVKRLAQNETYTIEAGEVHSLVALENTLLDEASTPYPEDTIRVKDYYERV